MRTCVLLLVSSLFAGAQDVSSSVSFPDLSMFLGRSRGRAIGTSLPEVKRLKQIFEEDMEPEPVPPDEEGGLAPHKLSPRVRRPDIYAFLPFLLNGTRHLEVKTKWSSQDLALARVVSEILSLIPNGPRMDLQDENHEHNRGQIRRFWRWFHDNSKKPEIYAVLIFTLDDGPLIGLPPSGSPADIKHRVPIRKGVEVRLLQDNSKQWLLEGWEKETKTWSRALCGHNGEPLRSIIAVGPKDHGEWGWVLHFMADSEHLHVYLDKNGKFLFYYHSW
jgi:hypothetical protein